jgi:starch phosphorylase
MTHLALDLSRYVNGVAMRHRAVSTMMFPGYSVQAITNGVHATTWTAPSFQRLFDANIPEWRLENFNLRYAVAIDPAQIEAAHREAKAELLAEIERRTGSALDPDVFTIVAARRATAYKRADLLFTDAERVRALAQNAGGMQILYAGKAHPRDEGGKEIIRRIFGAAKRLHGDVRVLYLADYDVRLAKLLVAGGDLWLNTPHKPQEASGTSGMKAALNGVPSLSVLDGWWIEGHVEGVTGWSIGENWTDESDTAREADTLYDKLETRILPLYYRHRADYTRIRQSAIALNGSFFTAERMVLQYAKGPYHLHGRTWSFGD